MGKPKKRTGETDAEVHEPTAPAVTWGNVDLNSKEGQQFLKEWDDKLSTINDAMDRFFEIGKSHPIKPVMSPREYVVREMLDDLDQSSLNYELTEDEIESVRAWVSSYLPERAKVSV